LVWDVETNGTLEDYLAARPKHDGFTPGSPEYWDLMVECAEVMISEPFSRQELLVEIRSMHEGSLEEADVDRAIERGLQAGTLRIAPGGLMTPGLSYRAFDEDTV
jgi:hypothetical protein